MNSRTRKHIWPMSLGMSIAIIGALAAFLVLTSNPGVTGAHGGDQDPHCSTVPLEQIAHDVAADLAGTTNPDGNPHTCDNPGTDDVVDPGIGGNGTPDTDMPAGAMFGSSSTSASASVELRFTSLPLTAADVAKIGRDGGSVELFLEDDFVVPDSISPGSIYFTLTKPTHRFAGGGGRVRATYDVEVNDGDFFGGDDDWAIQVYMPDLYTASVDDAAGFQGPRVGQTLTMVVTKSAGIRNPSEEGKHSVGYKFLGTDDDPDKDGEMKLKTNVLDDSGMSTSEVATYAKISLGVDNGGRGKEVTITGTGFNNDTDAEAFVQPNAIAIWWDTLDCMEMNDAVMPMGNEPAIGADTDGTTYCKMYANLSPEAMTVVMRAGLASADVCQQIVDDGDSLGTANVGSDDGFSIAFTVHQDEFKPGNVNFICAEDSEAGNPRQANAVKVFDLTASISLDPTEADSGDEVTLKARDFGGALTSISLGPKKTWTADDTDTDAFSIKEIDGNDYTFEVPGGLSGVIQVDAIRGKTRKTANLTITPSSLTLNQTEVAPNQSIIISGSGFSEDASILTSNIEIDGKMLEVDDAGTEGTGDARHVVTTSSGQFTATVNVWHDGAGNPALDADEYTIKVTDSSGYEGKTKITISEPTVMVTPQLAGPRDYITISGANWPVTTSEDDYDVSIEVDGKTRSASIDSTGRFNYEYRLSGGIDIGKEHDVKVTFTSVHGDEIEEETTFSVPSSNVVITPAAAAPGQTIDLEISGMPIGELVDEVTIDGGNRLGGTRLNTDRNGDVTITGILVPYSDPGFYPVKIVVGTGGSAETAIVQLEILADPMAAGTGTALPGALEELDDSLVRVFYFNTISKVWTFFDPRDEFADLNTLAELSDGQPYWILVNQSQENVVLNGQTRYLTCVGGDCWNQIVW